MARVAVLLLPGLLIVLPYSGSLLLEGGNDFVREFPPRSMHVQHAEFSIYWFVLMSLFVAATLLPLALRILRRDQSDFAPLRKQSFPASGRLGAMLCLVSWSIAWSRLEIFAPIQLHTFFPLWLGFILIVNGWCKVRTGATPYERWGSRYLGLYLLSAVFWWSFEYLNRFIQNWAYEGVENFSAGLYFTLATLSFSTVLPAVLGVQILIGSVPRISAPFADAWKVSWLENQSAQEMLLMLSCASLFFMPLFPNELFALVWIAPLILAETLLALSGRPVLSGAVAKGNWTPAVTWAASALVCGFFWELWNFHSLAKWIYYVPYVSTAKIFEMPLLGYAGYLPFGMFCGVITLHFFEAAPVHGGIDLADGNRRSPDSAAVCP